MSCAKLFSVKYNYIQRIKSMSFKVAGKFFSHKETHNMCITN